MQQLTNPKRLRPPVLAAATIALALAAGPTLAATGATDTKEEDGWSFRLEGLLSEVDGLQPTVAEIRKTFFEGNRVTSAEIEDVRPDYGSPLLLRAQLGRRFGDWGWAAGLSHLSADDALARGPLSTDLSQGFAIDITSPIFGSVTASSLPEPGVTLSSRHELELSALDLSGLRRLAERGNTALDLVFGLRLAELTHQRDDLWVLPGLLEIDHRARAESGVLVGPRLGLTASLRRGAHRFEAEMSQAVLTGDGRLEVEEETRVLQPPHGPAADRRVLDSSRTVSIPNAELRLGWSYRLSSGVSLGASAFASAWWAVPPAPVLSVFEADLAEQPEDSLVLSGLLLSVGWGG